MEPLRGTGPIQLPNNLLPEPPSKASPIDALGTPNQGDRVLKQGGGGQGMLDNLIERPKTGPLSLSQIDLSAIVKKPAPQQPQAPSSASGDDVQVDLTVPQFGRPSMQSGGGGNGEL